MIGYGTYHQPPGAKYSGSIIYRVDGENPPTLF